MRVNLLFILFFISTTICFGQENEDEESVYLEPLIGYSDFNKGRSIDSVYSFLQQIDLHRIVNTEGGNKRIVIVEKPMSYKYIYKNGWTSFARDMLGYRHSPILGSTAREIIDSMKDTVLLDRPIDGYTVSKINRDYIGVADSKAFYNFTDYSARGDSVNRAVAKNKYRNKKQQKIFIHGQEVAQRRLNSAIIVEMSIPYFDRSCNYAVLVVEITKEEPLFFLMFKRDSNGKWLFEGCYSNVWYFSTLIKSRFGVEKFFGK